MTKRTLSLSLDVAMLVVFAALMSWRFTGVPIHEWVATALLVVLIVHLLIHWHWIETRVRQLRRGPVRTRVNVALNLTLFMTMGAALVTGFLISKVIFPNALQPGDYLRWHGLHETTSTLTLVILGLHVALNWDLITSGVRRIRRGGGAARLQPRAFPAIARPLVIIVAASLLVAVGTRAAGGLLPAQGKVTMIRRGHAAEVRDALPEITRLRDDSTRPDLARGLPRFLLRFAMIGAVAVAGRKVLKLRLS